MLRSLGPVELLIIFGIILLLFGVGRISGLGRELGSAISEFRKGVRQNDKPDAEDDEDDLV